MTFLDINEPFHQITIHGLHMNFLDIREPFHQIQLTFRWRNVLYCPLFHGGATHRIVGRTSARRLDSRYLNCHKLSSCLQAQI